MLETIQTKQNQSSGGKMEMVCGERLSPSGYRCRADDYITMGGRCHLKLKGSRTPCHGALPVWVQPKTPITNWLSKQ